MKLLRNLLLWLAMVSMGAPLALAGTDNDARGLSAGARSSVVQTKSQILRRLSGSGFVQGQSYPSVYANPATVAFSTTSIITGSTAQASGDGAGLSAPTSAATTASNVVQVWAGYVAWIKPGMTITTADPTNNGIPVGTTITAVTLGSTSQLTLSNTVTVANGAYVNIGPKVLSFLGGVVSGPSSYYMGAFHNHSNASWTQPPMVFETVHYGTQLAINYRQIGTTPATVWIWEDGQPITAAPVVASGIGNSQGSTYWINVSFNNASDSAARSRLIRVYIDQGDLIGVQYSVSASLAPSPYAGQYLRVAVYGDSYVEGTAALSSFANGIAYKFSHAMGWGVPARLGQGGTGYIATSGATGKAAYTDATRIASLVEYNPDKVFILGSVNDTGQSSATITAAAISVVNQITALLPNAQIIIIGVECRGGNTSASDQTNNAALKTAAAQLGVPFIDTIQNSWLTGSGRVGTTTGNGNADVFLYSDGIHPTDLGADWWSKQLASASQGL